MKAVRLFTVSVLAVLCIALAASFAMAGEKMDFKGKIRDYDLDTKTMNVVSDEGKEMTFNVEDEKALGKLDDKLFPGDEVRIKYVIKDEKKIIKEKNDLRGTKAGC